MATADVTFMTGRRDVCVLLMIAVLPLLGFQFGIGNQVEQFPIISRLLDPAFAPGDFYVDSAAGFGPRYYYSVAMAALSSVFGLSLTVLVLTGLVNFGIGLLSFLTVRRHLGGTALAGLAAAALAVLNAGFALGLAGFITFDSFQPASLAILAALGGIYMLLGGRLLVGAGLFALAALFHPLIGVEVGLIAFAALFLSHLAADRDIGATIRRLPIFLGAGTLFIGLVFLMWGLPALSAPADPLSDRDFFAILVELRAPHHYLMRAQPADYLIGFAAFLAAAGSAGWLFVRSGALSRATGALGLMGLIVLACVGASILLVDILENRAAATAQVLRLLFLFKWVGYLLFGWLVARWIAQRPAFGWPALVLMLMATSEAQPRMMVLLLLASLALSLAPQRLIRLALPVGLLALAAAGVMLHTRYGSDLQAIRMVPVALALPFASGLLPASFGGILVPAGLAGCLIVFALVNKEAKLTELRAFTPVFGFSDLEGSRIDIARWASANTPKGSLWLIPPDFEVFRMVAGRGTIVDYTSIPFSNAGLLEWHGRISTVYGDTGSAGGFGALRRMRTNYRSLSPDRIRQIMDQYGATHAVLSVETAWDGATLYENAEYKVIAR